MAKLNFGGVEENVVTREEFPLSKAQEVLKNETVAVIGYGVQGPGQALNQKDNGINVIVGQRKNSKTWDKAVADGFVPGETLFEIEEALRMPPQAAEERRFAWPWLDRVRSRLFLYAAVAGFALSVSMSATTIVFPGPTASQVLRVEQAERTDRRYRLTLPRQPALGPSHGPAHRHLCLRALALMPHADAAR